MTFLRYIPASGINTPAGATTKKYKEFALDWWSDNAFYKHDSLLVSAFYMKENKCINVRDKFNMPKDMNILIDSGGYQVITRGAMGKEVDLTPESVMTIQEASGGDIALGFDFPPSIHQHMPLTDLFDKRLAISIDNYKRMIKARQETSNIELFLPLHGETPDRIIKWFDLMKDMDFEGFAVGPKPSSNALLQAFCLMYLQDQKDSRKKVHVLGVGGFSLLPLLTYVAKDFDYMSCDSCSYNMLGARQRVYLNPWELREKIFIGSKSSTRMEELPCNCPVCSKLNPTDIQEWYVKPDGAIGGVLCLHNLWIYLSFTKYLTNLSKSEDDFMNFTRKRFPKTYDALQFVKKCKEDGFSTAYESYRTKLIYSLKQAPEPKNYSGLQW